MIDIAKIKYELVVVLSNGAKVYPQIATSDVATEDNEGELAVRLEADFHNAKTSDGKRLHQHLPLGGRLFLYSDWGAGKKEVFRGTIFNWHYKENPLGTVSITAYDPLYYLKSKDDRYYRANTTAKAIIVDIAKAWGIPLGTVQGPNIALAKQVFRGNALKDMISDVLKQAKKRGAGKWIVRSKLGKIDIVQPGQNSPVYHFGADNNVSLVDDQQDIESLVTRVKIIGAEDKEGRAPVRATKNGRTEFGVLQELVYERQYDNLSAAKKAADEILEEYGKPQKKRKVIAPDLPFLRKGDMVHITAGTLNGYYIVSSIRRRLKDKTMTLEVEDVG
jgi:hypothetical protein